MVNVHNYLFAGLIVFGYWMGYVNSAINPICYAIGNPIFKEALLKMVCGKGKETTPAHNRIIKTKA